MGFHDVELMYPAIIDRHWEEINSWRNSNLVLWRQWEDFCIIIRSRSWFSIYLFFPRQQSYFFNSLQRRKYKDVEDRPWHNGDLDMGLESSRFAPRSPLVPLTFFPSQSYIQTETERNGKGVTWYIIFSFTMSCKISWRWSCHAGWNRRSTWHACDRW